MGTMIALLRGINVGGKVLKMELARASFEAIGLTEVRTYVQSGNIIFSSKSSAASLAKKIETQLLKDSGLKVSVILKTPSDLVKSIRVNPFLLERGIDLKTLHVTFLSATPVKGALARLSAIKSGEDRYQHLGTEIYVHCPNGYGRTKLTNNAIEQALDLVATTRNWNTVNKLHEMAAQ